MLSVGPRLALESIRVWADLIHRIEGIGEDPSDSIELRSQKQVLVLVSVLVAFLSIMWGAVYWMLGEHLAATIPWTYTASVGVSLLFFAATARYYAFRSIQLLLILLLPFLLQLALGGFVDASAVIIWSLLAPLGALAMAGRRQAVLWFVAYAALVLFAPIVQASLGTDSDLPASAVAGFFIANIIAATGVSFFALYYFVGQKNDALDLLETERAKSDRLLLNILPRQIANELKEHDRTPANRHDAVSVLFADMVDFTPMAEAMAPDAMVEVLNDVFSYFDSLAEELGLEKIRTVGDAYIVASGVPTPRVDHAQAIARMALAMFDYLPNPGLPPHEPLRFRIGISSGPAVSGVIGRTKFQYDIWGDTVNTASRMEATGVPGRIHVSPASHLLLADDFEWEPRGFTDIKGKGPMETWFLLGARASADS